MKTLLAAIKTYFAATSALTSVFTGGFHFRLAAPGTALPYLVYDIVAGDTTSKYGGAAFSEPQIQFTSWAVDSEVALTNLETLRTQLNDRTFTLASGQNFFSVQVHDPLPADDPEPDESGDDAAGWFMTYRYAATT